MWTYLPTYSWNLSLLAYMVGEGNVWHLQENFPIVLLLTYFERQSLMALNNESFSWLCLCLILQHILTNQTVCAAVLEVNFHSSNCFIKLTAPPFKISGRFERDRRKKVQSNGIKLKKYIKQSSVYFQLGLYDKCLHQMLLYPSWQVN